MQVDVVTVKFNKGSHGYWFSPNGLELHLNDKVIVDTDKGKDIVKVIKEVEHVNSEDLSEPLKNVIKIADKHEIEMAEENYKKAEALLPEIKEFVKQEKLDMKVITVESNYNFSRLTINFTSDDRVDFRDLVKKLADKYKTRCYQGFGINEHVSIKMAKNQNLSLNPNSISGLCGKLLCCLAYENPYYAEVLKIMPKVNSIIKTPEGEGRVMYNDLFNKKVFVKFQTESISEIKMFDVNECNFNK